MKLAWLLAFPFLALAQEYRGTILGRITDPTGAVVVGASIAVLHVETGVSTGTNSNGQGNYQVPFLLPGDYRIAVEHPGFKKVERPGIRVSINTQVTLDFTLEVGAAAETVTVTANAPLLTTSSADLGQVVDKAYVGAIAVSLSRNVINLTRLAPGVTASGTGTYTSNAQSDQSISGGGGTRGRNEFMVDGIPNTVPQGGGLIVYVPSVDSVEEVKVHTTLFDAAYGHSNGGAVNITTRGGANQFHGAVYDFKRWRALNANSWTNNRLGVPKPPVKYNQWGYTVGGPIRRNRTFFSTSLERDSEPRDLTRQARVPTEAERNGDFSQSLTRVGAAPLAIYDPASGTSRQPFAGARIPTSRITPIGGAVLKLWPTPNLTALPQIGRINWVGSGVYKVEQKQVSVRIDHTLSDRQRLFGRFSRMLRSQDPDSLFPGIFDVDGSSSDLNVDRRRFTNFGLDDTYTFSPTFIGSLRYGLARRATTNDLGAVGFDAARLNLPGIILSNQRTAGYPIFRLGEGIPSIGSSSSREANDLHALLGNFTKLTGRHSLKFGVDYRLVRWNRLSQGNQAAGDFTFNPVFTQADPFTNSSADRTGTAMASVLLASPNSGSFGYNSPLSLQNHYLAWFVQEDWKVNPRLTVNFGVRYELETPYTERYNRVSYGFDRGAALPVQVRGLDLRGGIQFAGIDGRSRREGRIDGNNFGPRVGFAFSLNPKTVLRGGYGLFYSGQSYNTGFLGALGAFNATTPYVGSIDGGATLFTTLANPFPSGLREPQGTAIGPLAQIGDSLSFFNDQRVSPYNQQWQFSIQRELPSQILVEAAYVGMLSLKQFESFDLNEKPDRFLALGAAENTRVPNPFLGVFPATSTLGTGATIIQRRLWPAFPQFTTLTMEGANTGRAIYHALHLKVEKRLTHGLNFIWTYSNSKLIDNYTTSIVNPRRYRTVSEFDQAQVMRAAFTYQLPFRSGHALGRRVVEGWSLGGFVNLASGPPVGITQANGRPLRIRNAAKSGPIVNRLNAYFDTTAFVALPNQYTISPEPPYFDELRAPGTRSLSLSLIKVIPIRERLRGEVRVESTGFTNTPGFSAPGTNMSNAATFGVINSGGGARSMQMGFRLMF